MLSQRYNDDHLRQVLLGQSEYQPYPTIVDRGAWESLPSELREKQVEQGCNYLDIDWPSLPATLFMEYSRNGNRRNFEKRSFARRDALASLVIAECMEDEGRFLDDIVNGIWCICEESFWGVPAHNISEPLPNAADPIIDLFAGETAGLLAWTDYLLRPRLDSISHLVSERIQYEIQRRILDPFLNRDDFWWMGLATGRRMNNWNPWCNSNCLTAALLLEEDNNRRVQLVSKAMRSLDRFIDEYPSDGGCDEGTSYWGRAGASLFDCLELLYTASNGKIDVYDQPLIADIGRFLYREHIDGDYFVNFADGGARVSIPADLVYRYGQRIGDQRLMDLGSAAHHARGERRAYLGDSLLRRLPAIFNFENIEAATNQPPYIRDAWLDQIQVMTAREREGSPKGLYLACKGGHNAESHNHNDVGQFIVYCNGQPVIVDAGVGTYTAKTFSSRRYEIWTMQSAYHNLPTVNGVQQQAGSSYRASSVSYSVDDNLAELSLDIATAYPANAGIRSWRRTAHLERGKHPAVRIVDDFKLKEPSEDIVLCLLTPREPAFQPGSIALAGDNARVAVEYDGAKLCASSELIAIDDERLERAWGDRLYRILLRSTKPISSDTWTLLIRQV